MQAEQALRFGPYRFDPQVGQLRRGTHEVKLTPKVLAVLRVLVTRPGAVVTKAELFQTVWPDTVVGDDALTACIRELRRALHDEARSPRYIETVHRRGFRFMGKVVSSQYPVGSSPTSLPTPNPQSPTPSFVGRETELAQLHGWLAKAVQGERQLVFVSGEPGIGKTTLIEAFRQRLETGDWRLASSPPASSLKPPASPVSFAHGQCIEHYGAGEAYLPILEALGRLGRELAGGRLIEVLHQHAPTWLVQMSGLLKAADIEALQRKTAGATRERMLRELAEALEVLTAEQPLILWLEDLHWSDYSTLDLLSVLARRREAARLLILGTYRPVEVLTRGHPLKAVKHDLQLHGQCEELALDFLSETAVREYLGQRFTAGATGRSPLQPLARLIHRRTDGNPLFMVNVVNDLVARGVLVQSDSQWELQGREEEVASGVPESLQQLIAQQLERLRPEAQRLLEVASVAGAEFSAAAVAAGVETEVEVIEDQCEELARREQFLQASGTAEWPDGTVAARYGFRHALYQEVLYHRLTARRRQRLHQQIGEREEQSYGKQAREIAAELAMHFERGRDYKRAVQYLQYAGENAVRRAAHQEAISLLTKGLELLKTLPDTPERTQQELKLYVALGTPLVATKGYTAPEVERVFARARELCQQVGDTPQLFQVLEGLYTFHMNRAEFQTARALGEQLLSLAQREHDPFQLAMAHRFPGIVFFFLGELVSAREYLERSLALADSPQPRFQASLHIAPIVSCLTYLARDLWCLGYPAQALQRSHEAVAMARESAHPFPLAYALGGASWFHQLRREAQAAQELTEEVMALATEQGFPWYLAGGTPLRGWVLAEQGQGEEGIGQIQQGLAAYWTTGTKMGRPWMLTILAEACGKVRQTAEGLNALAEALELVSNTGERWYEAELWRVKGELLLTQEGKLRD